MVEVKIEADRDRPVPLRPEGPANYGEPPRALHGEDISAIRIHVRRDGRFFAPPTVEVELAGGEIFLLDTVAVWRLAVELYQFYSKPAKEGT